MQKCISQAIEPLRTLGLDLLSTGYKHDQLLILPSFFKVTILSLVHEKKSL